MMIIIIMLISLPLTHISQRMYVNKMKDEDDYAISTT
jgi:hypothetical protein